MKKSLIALSVGLAMAASAFATTNTTTATAPFAELPKDKYPSAIVGLANGGLLPVKQFEVIGGLRGWVMKNGVNGDHTLVYTPEGGDVVMAGMLIDNKGRNMTQLYAAEHMPKPDHTPAFKAFSAGGEAHGVVVGKASAKAEITVIFDANCGFCKLLTRMLDPSVDAGELKVRYIPVGILSDDSKNKAAGLLAAKDPGAAVAQFIKKGGPTSTDRALLEKVEANTRLMQKYGFNGTPAVLYKDTKGNLMVSAGLPSITPMYEALGIPSHAEELSKDAQLKQYLR